MLLYQHPLCNIMGMLLRRYHPEGKKIYGKGETTSMVDVRPELTNVAEPPVVENEELNEEPVVVKQRGRPRKKEQ